MADADADVGNADNASALVAATAIAKLRGHCYCQIGGDVLIDALATNATAIWKDKAWTQYIWGAYGEDMESMDAAIWKDKALRGGRDCR